MSSFTSGFGAVNNLSPAKIEFSTAKKHIACPSQLISGLLADKHTCVYGNTILVVATIRIISQISAGV